MDDSIKKLADDRYSGIKEEVYLIIDDESLWEDVVLPPETKVKNCLLTNDRLCNYIKGTRKLVNGFEEYDLEEYYL